MPGIFEVTAKLTYFDNDGGGEDSINVVASTAMEAISKAQEYYLSLETEDDPEEGITAGQQIYSDFELTGVKLIAEAEI